MNWDFFLEALLRSTAVLVSSELLLTISKRQPAGFRHRLVVAVFAALALLPLLCAVLPTIAVPVFHSVRVQSVSVTVGQLPGRIRTAASSHGIAWPAVIWFFGFTIAFLSGFVGALSMFRIVRAARELRTETLAEVIELLGAEQTTPPILLSDQVSVPLTCGVLRPCILLPGEAMNWSISRLHAVLAHELSHIRRHDITVQVFAHLVCALWWFQPLLWLCHQRLRRESEMACDAEALRADMKPSVYASELLAIAKSLPRDARFLRLAIGMARQKHLEMRIRAVLTASTTHSSKLRQVALAAYFVLFAMAASALTLRSANQLSIGGKSTMKKTVLSALFTSVGLSAATISGSVHSTTGEIIPDAKVVIYNPDTGVKQEVSTGSDGTFSVAGAGAGQYILRIEKPGFNSIFRAFDVKADSTVNRDITMAAPGMEETGDTGKNSEPASGTPLRVKGTVAQSNLIAKVQPKYPVEAKSAGIQGTVELEITITKDGVPAELRVVRSPSDDLSESALEAVRQWRYRPTLLNGAPVEIVSTVIVNYTLLR